LDDLSRFEGEGGRAAPIPNLVDIPLGSAKAEAALDAASNEENDNVKLNIERTRKIDNLAVPPSCSHWRPEL
jgi:hypothetical protein